MSTHVSMPENEKKRKQHPTPLCPCLHYKKQVPPPPKRPRNNDPKKIHCVVADFFFPKKVGGIVKALTR